VITDITWVLDTPLRDYDHGPSFCKGGAQEATVRALAPGATGRRLRLPPLNLLPVRQAAAPALPEGLDFPQGLATAIGRRLRQPHSWVSLAFAIVDLALAQIKLKLHTRAGRDRDNSRLAQL